MARRSYDFSLKVPTVHLKGQHQSGGDDDFHGNGPEVTFDARMMRRGPKLFIRSNVIWKETKHDFTTFKAESDEIEVFNVDQRFPEWKIKNVNGNSTFDYTLTDPTWRQILHGHGIHRFWLPGSRLVSSLQIHGDADGGWFGCADSPWIDISFNPVEVVIELP